MAENDIQEILDAEQGEYMNDILRIRREREEEVQRVMTENRQMSPGGMKIIESRERLKALRKNIECRLDLRMKFGKYHPQLFSESHLTAMETEIEQMLSHGEPNELGETGDILAFARNRIKTMKLQPKWQEFDKAQAAMSVSVQNSAGAIVAINSAIGEIQSQVKVLQQRGHDRVATAIEKVAEAIRKSERLDDQEELLQNVSILSENATLPPEERKMGHVKAACTYLNGLLMGTANVAQIWGVWGKDIKEFFGIH